MSIGFEFQKRYATVVLVLEWLNKDLSKVLHEVQQYCYEVRPLGLYQTRGSSFVCGWAGPRLPVTSPPRPLLLSLLLIRPKFLA